MSAGGGTEAVVSTMQPPPSARLREPIWCPPNGSRLRGRRKPVRPSRAPES